MSQSVEDGLNTVVLCGIKPTGRVHLGNYIGSIRPALDMVGGHSAFFFIADYHALTTVRDPAELERHIEEAAATCLALGLDPNEVVFYRQSEVPEIFELMWILACVSAKGLFNRSHAYKGAVDRNLGVGRDVDADISMGLFSYPLLMAADILLFQADLVPVGRDQRQHVEIARDIAVAFNRRYGPVFNLPQASIADAAESVPGIDGRKMSKSYNNEISLLAEPDELKRRVMRIVTDSKNPEVPLDPEGSILFLLYHHFANRTESERLRRHCLAGGLEYKMMKEMLVDLLSDRFRTARQRYHDLLADRSKIRKILTQGASRARRSARATLERARRAVGIDPPNRRS